MLLIIIDMALINHQFHFLTLHRIQNECIPIKSVDITTIYRGPILSAEKKSDGKHKCLWQ